MVVGGVSSGSNGAGTEYLTVHASPPRVQKNDPEQCAARFEFSTAKGVQLRHTGESSGNIPDKFYWRSERNYVVDGRPLAIALAIDGREWTMIHENSKYKLNAGNHFRVKIGAGPSVEIQQLPIVDRTVDRENETRYAISVFEASRD
jgi:hypothetical protein